MKICEIKKMIADKKLNLKELSRQSGVSYNFLWFFSRKPLSKAFKNLEKLIDFYKKEKEQSQCQSRD